MVRFALPPVLALALLPPLALGADWPQFRGPNRNGVSSELNLPASWTPRGPGTAWSANLHRPACDGGVPDSRSQSDSSPAVAGGRVFLMSSVLPLRSARTLAFQESDGGFLWEHCTNVYETAGYTNGFQFCIYNQGAASPAVQGGRVCTATKEGRLLCLDAAADSPRLLWERRSQEELRVCIHNCADGSPLFYGDTVVFHTSAGGTNNCGAVIASAPKLLAFNVADGGEVWRANPNSTVAHGSWASPILIRVNNRDLIVYAAGNSRVYAIDPQSPATPVWSFNASTSNGGPTDDGFVSTPVFFNNTVYAASGEDPSHSPVPPGTLWAIDATRTGDIPAPRWRYTQIASTSGSPVIAHDSASGRDILYVGDVAGTLHALDAADGGLLWTRSLGSAIWASPTFGDGKLYLGTQGGIFYILRAGASYVELDRDDLRFGNANNRISSSAAIANGRVYVATASELFAVEAAGAPDAGSCPVGLTSCNGSCVDTSSSLSHCGGCNRPCGANQVCTAGACACSGGLTLCTGACVSTATDSSHCGRCNNPCGPDRLCQNSSCACRPTLSDCAGECVNTETDGRHCGDCNQPCQSGLVCSQSACASSCAPGLVACGQTCADLQIDLSHCGACGRPCVLSDANPACEQGQCEIMICLPGFFDLDTSAANGCEYACTARGREACNGLDDDCNGQVDEGASCQQDGGFDGGLPAECGDGASCAPDGGIDGGIQPECEDGGCAGEVVGHSGCRCDATTGFGLGLLALLVGLRGRCLRRA